MVWRVHGTKVPMRDFSRLKFHPGFPKSFRKP